jgi:hypothetical protein
VRGLLAILVFAVVVTVPRWVPAQQDYEPDDQRTLREQITRDQIEALHDLQNAETEEEAEEAKQRFNEASQLEVDRRRGFVDEVIERGGAVPPSERPPPPHP